MIPYPNISAQTDKEQLHQLKSYLYRLAEQLNHTPGLADAPAAVQSVQTGSAAQPTPSQTFAQLKDLIIKSADIVSAYTEEIGKNLEGKYVAQSEFGAFSEETASSITATSEKIDQTYHSLQQTVTELQTQLLETAAYIRTGILFYAGEDDPLPAGAPVYGMEVGQTTADGTFHQFGRFTSYSLSFFDAQGQEFAAITQGKMHLHHLKVTYSLSMGGFTDEILPDGTIVTRWKGV